jgi:hypothetical protein
LPGSEHHLQAQAANKLLNTWLAMANQRMSTQATNSSNLASAWRMQYVTKILLALL